MASFWLQTTDGGIPYFYFIVTIFFTIFFFLISVQQICISQCKDKKKTMKYRVMTAIWCFDVLILNSVQIYSYHEPTKIVFYILRLLTGISVIVVSIATYSYCQLTVQSMYQTRNMIKPIWFKQTWDLMLLFCNSTLIILYSCAFTYNLSLFFDIHWLCVGITFWVGTISTVSATCKITFFLHNTINEIEYSQSSQSSQYSQYSPSEYNTFLNENDAKLSKLKNLKRKLVLIIIISAGLCIPITFHMTETIRKIINISLDKEKMEDLQVQPFPRFGQYFAFVTWLCAMSLTLILWNYNTCRLAKHSCYHVCCNYDNDNVGELDPMYTKWSADKTIKKRMMEMDEISINDSCNGSNNVQVTFNILKKLSNSDLTPPTSENM